MPGNRQQVAISRIINETAAAKTFVLQPVDGRPIPYLAGQFLTFIFDTPFGEQRRNYSISSSSLADDPLSITVKRVVNGTFSRILLDRAQPGDLLTTIGASGRFLLPQQPEAYEQFIFFAAGSGITPVYSLIKTILYSAPTSRVVLIYSNRSEEDAIFRQQLLELQKDFAARLTIEWLFSSVFDRKRARLSNVLVKELMEAHIKSPLNSCLFYLCGPHDYMRMIRIMLLTIGIPAASIRKEEFVTVLPVPRVLPPDLNYHRVDINLHGQVSSFMAGYPDTILDAGLKAGLQLPYSCKTGRCGTCVALCSSGQVWMAQNEVLTSADISKGLVLTCTAYPIDGPVGLDFEKL
jgi:ring-1,2-phenylacetyl-CoA epoxidase subunit PaaE